MTQITEPTIAQALETAINLENACTEYLSGTDTSALIVDYVVKLRLLNRTAQETVQHAKEATNASKQQVDDCHLDIQNITYRHKHLKSEIAQSKTYESRHDRMDLVPLEVFMATHPEMAGKTEHEVTLARLQDEEEKRLELFQIKTKLNEERKVLAAEVKSLKDDLDDIKTFESHVDKIIDSAEALKKVFDKH